MNRERGAATVTAVAMIGLLSFVTIGVVGATALIGAHRRAQNAADLSALGAATALQEGSDACGRAVTLARRNDVVLVSCRIVGDDVIVSVSAVVGPLAGHVERLGATARAGPAASAR